MPALQMNSRMGISQPAGEISPTFPQLTNRFTIRLPRMPSYRKGLTDLPRRLAFVTDPSQLAALVRLVNRRRDPTHIT